ncbi:MAG TPA: DUF6602 domain-containing protein [Chitinophagales bacterium]|nr:DUF6602 domain-containing protein [Chitinophagales bacterium]
MAYAKLIENIANAIDNQLTEISIRYNFDYGEEFEIAICTLLSKILPDSYGICRGFVVTPSDEYAGDDIIIYDKDRFPTLRLLARDKFDRKQEIPIEAVYSYLEAKHTLHLLDSNSGQSIYKAFEQVSKVKSLSRDKRDLLSVDAYTNLGTGFSAERPNWPNYTNPIFGGIISRFIKNDSSSPEVKPDSVSESMKKAIIPPNIIYPDLVVLGQKNILYPVILTDNMANYDSPFFIDGKSTLLHTATTNSSLALGITMLLFALDTIKLGKMPYQKIILKQIIPNS